MRKEKINIRKHGFLKVPRMALMALYDEEDEEHRICAGVYIHLLSNACFIPRKEVYGWEVIMLQRGELVSTRKELARRLRLSRRWMEKSLLQLESYGLVEMDRYSHYTIFRVTDYNDICGQWEPVAVEKGKQRLKARNKVAGSRQGYDGMKDPAVNEAKAKKFDEWKRQHKNLKN